MTENDLDFSWCNFTGREWSIIVHLKKGCKNKQIAKKTGLSINVVKNNVEHIMWKLDVKNRTKVALLLHGIEIDNEV